MASLLAFVTTTLPVRAFVTTPKPFGFVTTTNPLRAFVQTPLQNVAFITTTNPLRAFITTLPPQRSTELILDPALVGQSTDCLSITLQDSTGTYPDSETGYNPETETDNPLRAKRSQVQLWIVLVLWYPDGSSAIIFPDLQNDMDPNFVYVFETDGQQETDGSGTGADLVFEIYEIGAPGSESWADWNGREDLIDYAKAFWYASSIGYAKACASINCVNDAGYRWCKAKMVGKCKNDELEQKEAILTTMYFNISAGEYQEAAAELAELQTLCADSKCKCNC